MERWYTLQELDSLLNLLHRLLVLIVHCSQLLVHLLLNTDHKSHLHDLLFQFEDNALLQPHSLFRKQVVHVYHRSTATIHAALQATTTYLATLSAPPIPRPLRPVFSSIQILRPARTGTECTALDHCHARRIPLLRSHTLRRVCLRQAPGTSDHRYRFPNTPSRSPPMTRSFRFCGELFPAPTTHSPTPVATSMN